MMMHFEPLDRPDQGRWWRQIFDRK